MTEALVFIGAILFLYLGLIAWKMGDSNALLKEQNNLIQELINKLKK